MPFMQVDPLIKAIPMVLRHVPTPVFVFAGDGEMSWDLERVCRERGFAASTRWLDKVPLNGLRRLNMMCDAAPGPAPARPLK